MTKRVVIIGGGAAGFFAAAVCSEAKDNEVILFEKTQMPLAKVRISGGGRCNVTHHCFSPSTLVLNYPRGQKALRGPFSKFQPKDTISWFESRGVELKSESDGRMFPITNSSETIISCLMNEIQKGGVKLCKGFEVLTVKKLEEGFCLQLKDQEIKADAVILATGSSSKGHHLAESLGHTIALPVPSLFTFVIDDPCLKDLSGVSVPSVHISIEGTHLEQTGPLLITHWGLSGPSILKLSAWGARELYDRKYQASLLVRWVEMSENEMRGYFQDKQRKEGNKTVFTESAFSLPKNLWRRLLEKAGIDEEKRFAHLSKQEIHTLIDVLLRCRFQIQGKSTYKEEFVTCGGVALDEVNFQTMESKICKGLYFAGEVLDIDGVTGGFNFQNAWTTAFLAATAISSDLS